MPANGRCLDVAYGGTDNGTRIWGWNGNGSPAQTFVYDADAMAIVSTISGKVLNIADDTTVILYEKHGGDNQRWILDPSTKRIINPASGKALVISGGEDPGDSDWGGDAKVVPAEEGQEWSVIEGSSGRLAC